MNILITGAWDKAKNYVSKIESFGHSCCFLQFEDSELPCKSEWPDIVMCGNLFDHHPIENFTNLKYIQSYSVGLETFPLDYIKTHNIEIYNSADVYSVPIAEFAISGILQICKCSGFFYNNQKNHLWEKNRDLCELVDKNVCIVGCGNIGSQLAKRLKAFCAKIYGVRQRDIANDVFDKIFLSDNLYSALESSDIIVLALPLNDSTYHLFDEAVFEHIKDNSILVNVSRGKIIDEKALIENAPRFKGLVLDVFENEALDKNSCLWDLNNAIITPHNSFVSCGNEHRMWNLICDFLNKV